MLSAGGPKFQTLTQTQDGGRPPFWIKNRKIAICRHGYHRSPRSLAWLRMLILFTPSTVKLKNFFKIRHGSWPPCWKPTNRDISVTLWPIAMKLRKMTQNIEPSTCGGDAALCRITLTTCYYRLRRCRGCDDVLLVEAVWERQLHETVTTGVGVCSRRGSSSHHPPPSLHATTTWRHNHRITEQPTALYGTRSRTVSSITSLRHSPLPRDVTGYTAHCLF